MEVEAKALLRVSQASQEVPENMIMPRTPSLIEETNPQRIAWSW
jgi:hypothetical protein